MHAWLLLLLAVMDGVDLKDGPLVGPKVFVREMAFSRDSKLIAVRYGDSAVWLWDCESRRTKTKFEFSEEVDIGFDYQNRLCVYHRSNGELRFPAGNKKDNIQTNFPKARMSITDDGSVLKMSGDKTSVIWGIATKREILKLPEREHEWQDLSSNGRWLAGWIRFEKKFVIRDLKNLISERVVKVEGKGDYEDWSFQKTRISNNGDFIVISHRKDVFTPKRKPNDERPRTGSRRLSDAGLTIINVDDNRVLFETPRDVRRGDVYFALSADERLVFECDHIEGLITAWDWRSNKPVCKWASEGFVQHINLSADGKWCAFDSGTGEVTLKDIASGLNDQNKLNPTTTLD